MFHRPPAQACLLSRLHLFHSFAPLSAQFLKPKSNKGASRTRLTKDLQPGSSKSKHPPRLEVAPREHRRESKPKSSFIRDSLPHADPGYVAPTQPNPSFRRRPKQFNELDWNRRGQRRSRWDVESGRVPLSERNRQESPRRRTNHDSSNSDQRRDEMDKKYQTEEGRRMRKSKSEADVKRPAPVQPSTPQAPAQRSPEPSYKKVYGTLPISTEFYHPPPLSLVQRHRDPINASHQELVTKFTSPPLMPGLLSCLTDILGPTATPTPIQSLSMKWLLDNPDSNVETEKPSEWKQFLLASETGSGKSIAYLLPLLQNLKLSELKTKDPPTVTSATSKRALNPRALILAPTHELSRQLSGFAKALLHKIKLRVLCASRANVKNTKERDATTRKMIAQFEEEVRKSAGHNEELDAKAEKFPVDVVIGTPMKLLETVRGRGWDRIDGDVAEDHADAKLRRGRDKMVGYGRWRNPPEMGLANVEWVIVDEADVLFDPDFQATTRQLLADISEARGHPVPFSTDSSLSAVSPSSRSPTASEQQPLNYPFNLILTSATIPSALAVYLDKHHPTLMRLASPNLHHLPKTLQTEYVNWTGGNKFSDIERRIRKVWAEDLSSSSAQPGAAPLSKVLVFCNKSTKVNDLGVHLEQRGIKNIALTSTSDQRKRGSNQHLEGFLREHTKQPEETVPEHTSERRVLQPLLKKSPVTSESNSDPKEVPHVMITTSLLSRGLDFSPSIRHVFIIDEPRNMIDFLHRAGRAGRAGERGKVVVFGKMKGRGSAKAKDVRKRVGALLAA